MITMKTILNQLNEKTIAGAMIEMLAAHSEDFREDQRRYNEAICKLTDELKDPSAPSVADEIEAIHRQFASNLIFSGFLGFQANLDHYIDPVARTFLEVDPEIYLRENTAKRLPDYENAQTMRQKFFAALTPAQQEIYEDIAVYANHLQTIGPKLAHYYGFILGNKLLPRIVPGYCADSKLSTRYRKIMESYIGIAIQ